MVPLQKVKLMDIMAQMSLSMVEDPTIKAMCETIDNALHKTTDFVPNIAIMHNLRHDLIDPDNETLDGSMLIDLLAWQLHVDFYDPTLPFEVRRELTANSIPWHMIKGTPQVVEEIVTAVFSDSTVSEWFQYGGWPYRFRVSAVVSNVTEDVIYNLIAAIFTVKNTRSWLDYIELINRSNADWYFAAGEIKTQTSYITIGEPVSPRPVIAQAYAGVLPLGQGTLKLHDDGILTARPRAQFYGGVLPMVVAKISLEMESD
jgi:phage tail P2-like protein